MINTVMLVGLGFLLATLLAVLIAPAYRNRTMRLTVEALQRSLPTTEREVRAEQDRMRAEHAIRIHNLEAQLEKVTLNSARQKIEVNRRDARISELESLAASQGLRLEELDNAKRVLEQTVTDRLPKIEGRLGEARRLLNQRDTEVTTLAQTAQRQARAIAEATQINAQQGVELDQLKTALSTRAARNQDTFADARFDGEVALRGELEALRARARDQAQVIERLQRVIANPSSGAEPGIVEAVAEALGASSRTSEEAERAELLRLRSEAIELKGALAMERARAPVVGDGDVGPSAADLFRLRSTNQDLTAEIARLSAALETYQAAEAAANAAANALDDVVTGGRRAGRETPIAQKARIAALEGEARERAATIETLRAEVAGLNERLAIQATHYRDEMRRLGAGSVPASAGPADGGRAEPRPVRKPRRSLAERITDPREVEARVVRFTPPGERAASESGDGDGPDRDGARGSDLAAIMAAVSVAPSATGVIPGTAAGDVAARVADGTAAPVGLSEIAEELAAEQRLADRLMAMGRDRSDDAADSGMPLIAGAGTGADPDAHTDTDTDTDFGPRSPRAADDAADADGSAMARRMGMAAGGSGRSVGEAPTADPAARGDAVGDSASDAAPPPAEPPVAPRRRPRLLERITNIDRSSGE